MIRRALAAFAVSSGLMLAGHAALSGRRYLAGGVLAIASLAGLALAGCLAVAALRAVRRRLAPPAVPVRYRPLPAGPAAGPVYASAPPPLADPCACGLPAVIEVAGRPVCPECLAAPAAGRRAEPAELAAAYDGPVPPPGALPPGETVGAYDISAFEAEHRDD